MPPAHEIAHLAHVELRTPVPEESLEFFTSYLALTATVLESVVDKIGDRVEQKIAVADHGYNVACREQKPHALFIRRVLEQLHDFADNPAQIDVAECRSPVACLDIRDPQQ